MQLMVGLVAGVLLTIGAAFVYDTNTGRAVNGLTTSSADGRAPLVNWEVVNADWADVRARLRSTADDAERGWKRITG
jgi:hypothetical protein